MTDDGEHPKTPNVPLLFPRLVAANPAKFLNYVLVPGHPSGKDGIFLNRFGYRPRSEEDARALAATYMEQARIKLDAGDFELDEADEYGQRFVIAIEVRGVLVRSVWLLRPDGTLDLITPFSGFVGRRRERRVQ